MMHDEALKFLKSASNEGVNADNCSTWISVDYIRDILAHINEIRRTGMFWFNTFQDEKYHVKRLRRIADYRRQRLMRLEKALRDMEWDLAESNALVLSHEGYIKNLEEENNE